MKEKRLYDAPRVEIVRMNCDDIIRTSEIFLPEHPFSYRVF